MRRGVLLVPVAVAPLALGIGLVPASAAEPAASYVMADAVQAADSARAGKPGSTIKLVAGKAVFAPKALTARRAGTTASECTPAKYSFTITNRSGKPQTVRLAGKAIGTLVAGKQAGICAFTNRPPITGVFSLASSQAKLTVKITA